LKRFYSDVAIADGAILLDGRPVKTPARAPLAIPFPALSSAVATEWQAQGEEIDPRSMPLTGLSNAAIDCVAPDPDAFARTLATYGESDLLCYRADAPAELVARQAEAWDPLLDWARTRYDIGFAVTNGIVHTPQPPATVQRLREALAARDAFSLAAMAPLITIGGSLVTALALSEGAIDPDAAFAVTHLDEIWQAERWGEDQLAVETRLARQRDFVAAAQMLTLLR
jgi:chaperone required for assembly of F1-ATPase